MIGNQSWYCHVGAAESRDGDAVSALGLFLRETSSLTASLLHLLLLPPLLFCPPPLPPSPSFHLFCARSLSLSISSRGQFYFLRPPRRVAARSTSVSFLSKENEVRRAENRTSFYILRRAEGCAARAKHGITTRVIEIIGRSLCTGRL